jgi:hypothetical protein
MWLKIQRKYRNATRLVLTWNPNKKPSPGGSQIEWPWSQAEPPLYSIKWTVIGAPKWYEFDGDEKVALDKRNYADGFKRQKKPRGGGNRKGKMDPMKL